MKLSFITIVFGFCFISLFVVLNEMIQSAFLYIKLKIEDDIHYFGDKIEKLIDNKSEFINSQIKALNTKFNRLGYEAVIWIGLTMYFYLFSNKKSRSYIINICKAKMNILKTKSLNCKRVEINFLVIFVILCICTAYGNAIVKLFGSQFNNIVFEILFYLCLFGAILPFFLILICNLFKIFGSKLIIAYYITFYIKATAEFFTQDDINLDEFERVNIKNYSRTIRDYLKERSLENKIFQEKHKSDSINAALVGWGKYEHIEIYGKHNHFTDDEFEAILMHELGHSQDYSLHKKIIALYIIKGIEFCLIMWLWNSVTDKYVDSNISKIPTFLFLLIVYEMYLNRYLMIIHKLTSQKAEINADLIAKRHGFGVNLAKVLFKITIQSNEPIQYTILYNSLKSFHPTILQRIEYLL